MLHVLELKLVNQGISTCTSTGTFLVSILGGFLLNVLQKVCAPSYSNGKDIL